MRRIDRARTIRDAILTYPREEWRWEKVSDERLLTLERDRWKAALRTAFNKADTLPQASTYLQALILQRANLPLPNVLDLWVHGCGKVLSVEWDGDDLRLISMKSGSWESQLFGIGSDQNAN